MKLKTYLALFIASLGLTGIVLFVGTSQKVYADGGVGAGGSGSCSSSCTGGGHYTRNGWGWVIYQVSGPGPTDGFRNGTSWSSAQSTCQRAGARTMYANIVLNSSSPGTGMVYDYQSSWASFQGHFTTGTAVDNSPARATAISTATAQNAFNNLPSYGVNTSGYTFGSNVGWFCYDYTPPANPATCSLSASPNAIIEGNSTTITWSSRDASSVTVTGNGNSWSGTSGSRSDRPTTTTTYRGTASGPGGSGTCSVTVTVTPRPRCSISASPSSYVSGGSNTTTITWSSTNATGMTVKRGSTTLSTALSGSYTDNQSSSATYTGTVTGPGGTGNCSTNVTVYPPPTCNASPNYPAPNEPVTFTATGGDPSKPYTWSGGYVGNPYVTSYPTAGIYTVTVTNGNVTQSCSVTVVNKPYHRVFGGDTLSGVGFAAPDTTCPASSVVNGKRPLGFVRQIGGNYTGGGNSHANIATGAIVDFVSGMLEPGPSNPRAFAFANTGGGYGGNFSRANLATACATNYYSQMPGGTTALPPTTNVPTTDGDYSYTGNLVISGGTVPAGVQATIYVNGNVFISSNITFANSNAYSPNIRQIPSLRIVAQGSIYVGANVTELNGIFIAQPNGASGGTFYTCGFDRGGGSFTGPSSSGGSPLTSSEFVNQCATQQLTVYGAVVARDIKLYRSRGTLPTATEGFPSNAAERFIYTPDTWFNGDPSTSKPFQSYTALPPLL